MTAEGILSTTTSESRTQPEVEYRDDGDLSNLRRRGEREPRKEKPGSAGGRPYYFWEGASMHNNSIRDDETSSADGVV